MVPSEVTALVPTPYRVSRVQKETADVWTFGIEPRDQALVPPSPGQFNMLYAFGVGEVPISLSARGARGEVIHTIRSVGPVSEALCRLRKGSILGVRGPYGSGWPLEEAEGRDLVIVAGGIGLAPLRPVIHTVLKERPKFGQVSVLYGARNPEALIYRKEIEELSRRNDLSFLVTVDHATPGWASDVGVLPDLIRKARFTPQDALVLICGPEVMLRYVTRGLADAGLRDDQIYVSMERNMKCAIGTCGRCQFGPSFICKDGPVLRYDRVAPLLAIREV